MSKTIRTFQRVYTGLRLSFGVIVVAVVFAAAVKTVFPQGIAERSGNNM